MANDLKYSVEVKNAQQDAITSVAGANALIRLYDGAKPADPDTAVTNQNMLVQLTCSATFAPSASGGVLTLNTITNGTGTAAAGTGITATWFRLTKADGTAMVDGTVGISGCDMNLNNPNIAESQVVSISSFTITNGN